MKHAFLIIAHDNLVLLKRLLHRIDSSNSNIYLHIDCKAAISSFDYVGLKESLNYAKLKTIPSKNIVWGSFDLIDCELRLLKCALQDENDYFHFLSGHDYPIVSMNKFDSFFISNNGKEFIGFSRKGYADRNKRRYSIYHFFQNKLGKNPTKDLYYYLNLISIYVQLILKIDRSKKYEDIRFEMGSQWCSITRPFADYLINNEKFVRSAFNHTFCCDEVFIQTMFINSQGRFRNYYGIHEGEENGQNLRAIDWERGNPYTYSSNDFIELINSNKLIVRKVDTDTESHRKLLDMLDFYIDTYF